jgi:hypothetical protein
MSKEGGKGDARPEEAEIIGASEGVHGGAMKIFHGPV